jgi:hypothetical protein
VDFFIGSAVRRIPNPIYAFHPDAPCGDPTGADETKKIMDISCSGSREFWSVCYTLKGKS